MSAETFHYSIANETLQAIDTELVGKLPKLYPNPADRLIVERLLLPQFRREVNGVFEGVLAGRKRSDVPLAPAEIDGLCKGVDELLEKPEVKHKLSLEDKFKPMMGKVGEARSRVREVLGEEFRVDVKRALKAHNITDRDTLLAFGTEKFKMISFPPYGKVIAFIGTILGRTAEERVNSSILKEIADFLGWQKESPERYKKFRDILNIHGITSRDTLLGFGTERFRIISFPPFGRGSAFAGVILGRTINEITPAILKEIADVLELPEENPDERKEKFRSALAAHGITSRDSLLALGPVRFQKIPCPPSVIGKRATFAGALLGRKIPYASIDVLKEIADVLELPEETSDERMDKFRSVLAAHGITSRDSLLAFGIVKFRSTPFSPFEKGITFIRKILGRDDYVNVKTLEEVADILGWPPETHNKMIKKYCGALAANGITDRDSLLKFTHIKFRSTEFSPFGNGAAFCRKILGKRIVSVNQINLHEIADALGW